MDIQNNVPAKPVNPYRISFRNYCAENGIIGEERQYEFIEACVCDGIVPALCKEGCEVEPDGRCEHGCPSVLLALGMI